MVNDKEHTVPCVFQIWKRMHSNRNSIEKLKPINFMFVKKDENPDISFRRVGINAGVIDTAENINEKSVQSHYFIKFTNKKTIQHNLEQLSDNTVGPKSISKQELIFKFNPLLT